MAGIEVGIKRTSPTATLPTKGTEHAACFDVYADLKGSTAAEGVSIWTKRDDRNAMTYKNATRIDFVPQDGMVIIRPGDRALIPTGLIFDVPEGYCIKQYPRSGTSLKQGLTLINAVGVIDSDYTKESYIPVVNHSDTTHFLRHGERLAQIELAKVLPVEFVETTGDIEQKSDRQGGFGSTGRY